MFFTGVTTNQNLTIISDARLAILYPNYLPKGYFGLGDRLAYYTSGNGDYCAVFDKKYVINNVIPPAPVYPVGGFYPSLSTADTILLNDNMSLISECKRPTNEIYTFNLPNTHPYGCIKETLAYTDSKGSYLVDHWIHCIITKIPPSPYISTQYWVPSQPAGYSYSRACWRFDFPYPGIYNGLADTTNAIRCPPLSFF